MCFVGTEHGPKSAGYAIEKWETGPIRKHADLRGREGLVTKGDLGVSETHRHRGHGR